MDKKSIKLTESDIKQMVKESVRKILDETSKNDQMQQVNEAYNKYDEIQRFAYENQQIRPLIEKLASFAETVAELGKRQGKMNYYQFYSKLNSDILQMDNLWSFLDYWK